MKPYHFHINNSGQKKATISGVFSETGNQLAIGVAICSPKDNFNKKIGRAISTGRAEKKPISLIQIGGLEPKEICQKFVEYCKDFQL